jgi:hypothetical protein
VVLRRSPRPDPAYSRKRRLFAQRPAL